MDKPAKGRIAVIGGGIAGMSAAYRMQKSGFETTVYESRERVGGRMWSLRRGDFLMDVGMSAYLGTYRESIALIKEVGLFAELSELPAIGAATRGKKHHHFDYNKPIAAVLATGFISWPSKLRAIRMVLDTFRHRKSLGYSDYTSLANIDTETVQEYCARTLNDELRHYVAQPLVSGTWVADDSDTSIALLFWTVRNMLAPSVYNLNGGVMALPAELAKHVTVNYNAPVEDVTRTGAGVEVTSHGATASFDGAIIATTAEPAMAMYPQMDDNTRGLYATTRYRKLGNIGLGLRRRPQDGATYYLGTPHEDPDTIAVIADHIKAPCRAPAGKGLLTVLLSHDYLERSAHLSDQDVLDYAFNRAQKYYPDIRPDDLEQSNVVRWPESVPTLDRGRFKKIADYTKKIDRGSRVQFASDLDRIPGCNGALVSGQEAAARLNQALSRSNA